MERFCKCLSRMSRNQDRYSRSPKKVTIGARQVMVSADSDLDPEIIELMTSHQVASQNVSARTTTFVVVT